MIYDYEIISSPQLDRSKSYIDFKQKRLVIRGIKLPTRKYYMYLRKMDILSNMNTVYIAFVSEKVNPACKPIRRSDFGYYTTDLSEVIGEFFIKDDTNVNLELVESDDMIEVYEMII